MFIFIICINFIWDLVLAASFNVSVDVSNPVGPLSDKFISFGLDTWQVGQPNWDGMPFDELVPLAQPFAPAYYRFGGTIADWTKFIAPNATVYKEKRPYIVSNITINATQFDQLYNYTKNSGWRLIFDFNLLEGFLNSSFVNINGSWDSSNAKELIDYTNSKGYDYDFELGNGLRTVGILCNFPNITNDQLINGYQTFRQLISNYTSYKNNLLLGPSLCCLGSNYSNTMFIQFLNTSGLVDAISFHHYYFDSRTANESEFINITIMNRYKDDLPNIIDMKNRATLYKNTPLWHGEGATSYNAGAYGLSNTFINGFLWLDKLGLSAVNNIAVVVRQDFWGFNYSLVSADGIPYPDYWLTLLYKKLLGLQAYSVALNTNDTNLRLYAGSGTNNTTIVLYGFYLNNDTVTLDLPGLSYKTVQTYIFESGTSTTLASFTSKLNGNLLNYTKNTAIPDITQQGNSTSLPVTLPGYSQFFVVIEQGPQQSSAMFLKATIISMLVLLLTY